MAKDESESTDTVLEEQKELFDKCVDAETDQRHQSLSDLEFGRAALQWPENIARDRMSDGRPMLTINKLPSFIRQVVNDARQNRPDIKVKPVTGGNVSTANVFAGLIKSIEAVSRADIAYDTASDFAVSCGLGYFRVDVEYENDRSFDKKLTIKRIPNVFSVYGDFNSKEPDSSDWNYAFVVDTMDKDVFKENYKGAEEVNWEDNGYANMQAPWRTDNNILIAESWMREKIKTTIYKLSNNDIMDEASFKEIKPMLDIIGVKVVASRKADSFKIVQRLMTGAEILEKTEWAGKYIPIIPVYGEEINIEGKRRFNSLIWGAKDAQRMFNFWRTASTELVALAPRVPFLGEEGSFDVDGEVEKWKTSNTRSHPFLQYKRGMQPPQRLQVDSGPAVGAMSEAMAAADDIKAVTGMFDASLGQKSNETSGRAIMARQHEGDVSTFHFVDNLSRAIRHCGNILVDLIPKVYTAGRVVRIIQPDKKEINVQLTDQQPSPMSPNPAMGAPGMGGMTPPPGLGAPNGNGAALSPGSTPPTGGPLGGAPPMGPPAGPLGLSGGGSPMGGPPQPSPQPPSGASPLSGMPGMPPMGGPSMPPPGQQDQQKDIDAIMGVYNLGAGTYDVTVDTGPSYTTRREEVAAQMMELVHNFPQALPVIGDILVQALDWPRAEEIADRLKAMQAMQQGQIPPALQKQITEGMQKIHDLEQENMQLKAKIPQTMLKHQVDTQKVKLDAYDAETRRIAAVNANNRNVESNIMDFHRGIFDAVDTLHQQDMGRQQMAQDQQQQSFDQQQTIQNPPQTNGATQP